MGTLKLLKGKIPLSVITITICTLAFVMLFYTETISPFSFRLKSCPRRNTAKKSSQDDRNRDFGALNYAADDRFEFDPEECSLVHGKWVFNRSIKPLYSDRTCRYLDRQVSCVKNGRPDSDYRHWEWQPDDCILPRFDPEIALRKLQGKRLMFVGDSLHRGQWQSFVCLVDSVIPQGQKSMKRGRLHSVFKAKDSKHGQIGWTQISIQQNKSIFHYNVPLHERSADWGNENGTRCFNETKPITKKRYWGSGSNTQMMSVVARVVKRMKFPVTLINITQLSEYRIDAHTSIYTELGGKLLTDEQQADPLHYADCVHWCLPGVPDTWNQILYAHLL
ncbi:protein trichome birefringence-like 3 [Sesamum angolense]|uniref:Protein trichome birefringence-like 3 n=1 Tax=Sesamum angolense TaxID=2727404 RepID=A0AAE2BSG5_9LAMI|nr:protein trichome birefringence-like 3 [Sesamum angolense]